MRKIKTMKMTLGFIFLSLVFCVISLIASNQEAQAGPASFNFTYTTNDSTDTVYTLGNTKIFGSKLTNTGTEADSYIVTMIKNPPTPHQWTIFFCSGGVCHPPSVTQDTVYLPSGEWDSILVEITPDSCYNDAKVMMRVTSKKSPSLSKSIIFFLHAQGLPGCVPVTNRWGLLILITLLSVAGFYLIWKRSTLARTTLPS